MLLAKPDASKATIVERKIFCLPEISSAHLCSLRGQCSADPAVSSSDDRSAACWFPCRVGARL
eukprot:3298231-Prymnesium_polylepis.1